MASTVLSAALEVCREHGNEYLPAATAMQLAQHAHLLFLNTGAVLPLTSMRVIQNQMIAAPGAALFSRHCVVPSSS